jgi:hypothetical protein
VAEGIRALWAIPRAPDSENRTATRQLPLYRKREAGNLT